MRLASTPNVEAKTREQSSAPSKADESDAGEELSLEQ